VEDDVGEPLLEPLLDSLPESPSLVGLLRLTAGWDDVLEVIDF